MEERVDILLVDDRPEGLISLEAVLTDPGYNLVKASSGREALAHVLHHDFALILMDVQMPDMDGFETVGIIKQRERSRDIPIIFLTANSEAEHFVTTAYAVGALDYVFKPLNPHILRAKVAVFVDLHRKNLKLREQAEALHEAERRDRLRTLNELEMEGRRRYQNLADAIPQAVFRSSELGAVDYFNQYWHVYTGRSPGDSLGAGWQSVVHPKELPHIVERWEAASQQRTGFECECRLRRGADGQYRWHILRVVPEFNHLTQFVSWIGVASDIHDQKMTQEELILAKRMADAASEAKSRFLANMSHEIRTPLGIILGFSELLVNPDSSETEKEESIASIRRNGVQLSRLIDEILDLSKVEANKLEVDRTAFSLPDLMSGVKALMSFAAKEKGIALEFRLNGPIPAKLVSNAGRLQQILVNVIGNGIKFSPRGGALAVTLSHQAAEGFSPAHLNISVKDTGPGMSSEQVQALFQPFTQVDTSMTRKHGGTGLGLALSRRLARLLGGDIRVEASEPGQGCDFHISIESGAGHETEMVTNMDCVRDVLEPRGAPGPDMLNGVKVLLVEDSLENQVLVSRFLTLSGAKVEVANNGVEGVEKAMAGDHNVVLMDIQMPELDGYGAISRLRQQGFKKPIIALTAHGMVEDRLRCLEVGSNDHLTKPVNRGDLIHRVQRFAAIEVG
mgnify:CR=1 FL=1